MLKYWELVIVMIVIKWSVKSEFKTKDLIFGIEKFFTKIWSIHDEELVVFTKGSTNIYTMNHKILKFILKKKFQNLKITI